MATLSTPGLFITGTDTEVGKTYVAAIIASTLTDQGHRVGVYKPVASGCHRRDGELVSDDAVALWEAAGQPGELSAVCLQCFEAPLAPNVAAREEGKQVDAELLRAGLDYWADRSDFVLVEGVGGLMTPVSDEDYVADLAFEFGFPLIVVAPNALGVINQSLQTLITAATFREGIDVAGVVLNDIRRLAGDDASTSSNRTELASHCVPPVLAHLGWGAPGFDGDIDWIGLARGTAG
ncbi:MAG: dethiobiotin synthase [Planctomycetes bacterium]|nr:dethiobiotin synthase [Planctomycetota bacterium]